MIQKMSFAISAARLAPRRASPPRVLAAGIALAVLGAGARARADECSGGEPWARLGASASNFARPLPVTLTALAVVAPFGFAPTGLDQRLRIVAQRDLGGRPNLEPVSVWTPYVLAGGLAVGYGISVAVGSCSGKRGFSPLLQAGVLTFVGVGALKLAVGRRWPNGGRDPSAADRLDHPDGAHDFAPFQRGFAAWPSGHTALLFAGAAAFRASNPELGWASWLGYPLAVGVAGGMWFGDHHYASDIISGALLGEAVGSSVGQSFSQALGVPGELALVPRNQGGFAVQWQGQW
ncbi:MAG TPA: phosphatase PAP2 family protein [Polyangiaceae bacterium]|nr:phosphatase PAP2 family protein [Polyangiaceae bacterium]